MAGLAENTLQGPSVGVRVLRWLLVLAVIAAVGLAAWWLKKTLGSDKPPARQIARITILPDTPPPPPPPPPKEEPRPQPRPDKPAPQEQTPKPADTPKADAPIKMEGAAGEGPSPFAAGSVEREYQGGPPSTGPASGGVGDRMAERLYAQTTRQQLQAEIERHLRSDAVELAATFSLWMAPDGAIQRYEISEGASPRTDADLSAALDAAARSLRLGQPPAGLVQPMRFRLTVRPLG